MTVQVRAHFDGKVIVPDEPVELPLNQPLTLQISVTQVRQATEAELDAAFERLLAMRVPNANIPDQALASESLYADED
jgi:hypothetical protein